MNDAIAILADVVQRLENHGIEYLIGGSFASIIFGESRLTRDINLVLSTPGLSVVKLEEAFHSGYMVDRVALQKALDNRDCNNLIHEQFCFQIDVFFSPDSEFARSQFQRRVRLGFDPANPSHEAYFASPEDIVLNKLIWFRDGNEVSKLQWGDAVGVLRVQKTALDFEYLSRWAVELSVSDLLNKALAESEE